MADVVARQEITVLNAFAAIFENALVSKDLVTWKKFDGEMNDRNGLRVSEQVTPDYYTEWTQNGVKDLTAGVQDTVFGSEIYALERTINSSMGWGDFQKIKTLGDARESQALRKSALRLATDVDSYVMAYLANVPNNWLGDGESNVAEWDDIAGAFTRLKEEGAGTDGLRAVLTYADKQALGKDVVESVTSGDNLNNIGSDFYRNGFDAKIAGIPTMFTQQLPAFTTGTRTAGATNYATGTPVNDYEDVAQSPAPGQYLTGLLAIDGVGATGTVKEGEVFTIAGVYAWDNRAKKRLTHLQQFRVVGGTGSNGINAGTYTATTGAIGQLRYFPAIIVDGPYKTVDTSNASWNDQVITFKGAASATLHPRIVNDKESVIINTADLVMPATGKGSRVGLQSLPLSIRMWKDSVFTTGEHRIRFDVAVQANVVDRRRSVRINGG